MVSGFLVVSCSFVVSSSPFVVSGDLVVSSVFSDVLSGDLPLSLSVTGEFVSVSTPVLSVFSVTVGLFVCISSVTLTLSEELLASVSGVALPKINLSRHPERMQTAAMTIINITANAAMYAL